MISQRVENEFIKHLVIKNSLEVLTREGLPEECVTDEDLRKVYNWALRHFQRNGMNKPPIPAQLFTEFEDTLLDVEVEPEEGKTLADALNEEPETSIENLIDELKGEFIKDRVDEMNKQFAVDIMEATSMDRLDVLDRYASDFVGMSMRFMNQESRVEVTTGIMERISDHEDRSRNLEDIRGMRLGLVHVDEYTRGIRPGELAVLAAGPKVGKSLFVAYVALKEWQAGKSVVLFTLENSVEMTLDRMACLALGLDTRKWDRGECSEDEIQRAKEWVDEMGRDEGPPFYVIQAAPGQRTVQNLVRQAQLMDVDALIIDQLSYIEAVDMRRPRHFQIQEITHELKGMISTGRKRMPCLLAHQISREGVKSAEKLDRLEMYHLAEGSETERTADWVWGLFRPPEQVATHRAKLQTLAARREENQNFDLRWNIGMGHVASIGTYQLEDEEG